MIKYNAKSKIRKTQPLLIWNSVVTWGDLKFNDIQ